MNVQPRMPFWGLDLTQLDSEWIDNGFGVEAILFTRGELEQLREFEANLGTLPRQNPLTLHFPMDADYGRDVGALRRLEDFLDIAVRCGAEGVTIHSNCLVPLDALPSFDIAATRAAYLAVIEGLADQLRGSGVWLGVENMPVMGDLGDDVDPLFVFPSDFAGLAGGGAGVTFDAAHWLGTIDSIAAARRRMIPDAFFPPLQEVSLIDPVGFAANIKHFHLSATTGVALPHGESTARGGEVPSLDGRYRRLLESVLYDDASVSLEISEVDYSRRRNLWRTLRWLRDVGLVAA